MKEFYHFDSWRTNVQPNLWLPTSSTSRRATPRAPAAPQVQGHQLRLGLRAQGAGGQRREHLARRRQRAGRLQRRARRQPARRAARVGAAGRGQRRRTPFQAGLLDAPSDFDKISSSSQATFWSTTTFRCPAHPVRMLLTEPLESSPWQHHHHLQEPHRHHQRALHRRRPADGEPERHPRLPTGPHHPRHRLDTKYAFNDRLLFPSTSVFERIPMHHTAEENAEAPRRPGAAQREGAADGSSTSASTWSSAERLKSLPASTSP